MSRKKALSEILPPFIFGAGTFNPQHNKNPDSLNVTGLITKALSLGIRAFDTSPHYGPSEELLGSALEEATIKGQYSRDDMFIITKVGRIGVSEFDYSPNWIRTSIQRSLNRLKTEYLDVVYCHDVEFVSSVEVLNAIKELRRLRDEDGIIKYIGISGYPISTLCELAEFVLENTRESLDIVMSYANFTLQNTLLVSEGVQRLKASGVDVVPNASPLGMGFLRKDGPPIGTYDFHPASAELRAVVKKASDFCDLHDERLELVAIRFALENWLEQGAAVGSSGDPASGAVQFSRYIEKNSLKLGVSVVGISNIKELSESIDIWRSILDGLDEGQKIADAAGRFKTAHRWSLIRKQVVNLLAEEVKHILGKWYNYTWPSPPPGYANIRQKSISR